jgi:hypothetical protein
MRCWRWDARFSSLRRLERFESKDAPKTNSEVSTLLQLTLVGLNVSPIQFLLECSLALFQPRRWRLQIGLQTAAPLTALDIRASWQLRAWPGSSQFEWTRLLASKLKKRVQKTNHWSRRENLSAWPTAFVYKFLQVSLSWTQCEACFHPLLQAKTRVFPTQITSAQLKTTPSLVGGRTCHLTTWT